MNSQINVRMPNELLNKAQEQATAYGYSSVQEFIRETIREKVFGEVNLSKEELKLVKKLASALEKTNDYGTEEDLLNALP